jgi:long-chain-fatty-acid---luciferin-component ligase
MQLDKTRQQLKKTQEAQFVAKFNEKLASIIPARHTWTPAEEALYQPVDLFRVPLEEAQDMQLKAIKFTFTHHYRNNDFYHRYCEGLNIAPDDIKTNDDLDKIPLIPDAFFKQHPSGKDFAYWLAGIFTGDLPKVVVEGANPTFDDVVNAFNEKGLAIMYSSGTTGRFSVIPRDMRTFQASEYAIDRLSLAMSPPRRDDHLLMLFPNPAKTNLFVGRATDLSNSLYSDVQYALDFAIPSALVQKAMSANEPPRGATASAAQSEMQQKLFDTTVKWLERLEKTEETVRLAGPPFLLMSVLNSLRNEGMRFDFGDRGGVSTGGGWKMYENARSPLANFRKLVEYVLGIPETRCIDCYTMCESNGLMAQCPEGHYLHTPYTFFKPLVLDDALTPIGYGESGRFAFLDAVAGSYPGFIMSGDHVRLLERCPVCDRPGPVLEPEVQRAEGEEVRGCAEELQRVLAEGFSQ